jgi:two-component system phosphate regulon sensor histidine kinase PhoR
MNNRFLGKIILGGTVVLVGLFVVQLYWFKKAFDAEEKQFDHTVQIALKRVGDSVAPESRVQQLASNFFFVATGSSLDSRQLEGLLNEELSIRNVTLDYELGVYDADDDTLVYGNYVRATRRATTESPRVEGDQSEEKNFAVFFPRKMGYVTAKLDIWIFSTFVLLLMMGFFGYAIYSLLQERKFAALKNDFINNMTHEFKTPVTNIRIAGEVLKQKMDANDSGVYLDILLKENDKLLRKIDQVLLGSTVEGRRPRLEQVDIHQLIHECADAFQFKIRERQGSFQLHLEAHSPTMFADRELLAQAISNVIDNAEKYSPQNPSILVQTRDSEKGIEISVVDQGIGIAADMKLKVFEKFFRVNSGNLANIKGFGLGLSFVRDVIKSHRGSVNLFSELNKGTQVTILLPRT